MDTNTEPQINSFAGGLNSDDDISVVSTNQYLDATNIRISQYKDGNDGSKENRNGVLTPIKGAKVACIVSGMPESYKDFKVVATGSIRDYGVVVCTCKNDGKDTLVVFRFKNAIGGALHNQSFYMLDAPDLVVNAPLAHTNYPDKFSMQLNYESEDNIKLYIADSLDPIMVFNIRSKTVYDDLDKCYIYPTAPCQPPKFECYIPGKLKYSMVSYSYMLYNKYGQHSDVSVACKQIPIGNYNFVGHQNFIQSGGKLDAQSNSGVMVSIQIPKDYIHLGKMKVFRIQYLQNGQMPTISVIYDAATGCTEYQDADISICDTGQEALEQISVEEYNSMQGVRIIPNSLAVKNGYLFAANTKTYQTTIKGFEDWDARAYRFDKSGNCTLTDVNGGSRIDIKAGNIPSVPANHDCFQSYNDINTKQTIDGVNQVYDKTGSYIGGSGLNVEWRFIISPQVGDSCKRQHNGQDDHTRKVGTLYNYISRDNVKQQKSYYITSSGGVQLASNGDKFDNGIKSNTYLLQSLRRNELYRYGIVLYDKYGQASPAKWIADIRTPNITDPQFNIFTSNTMVNGTRYELVVRNLGIQFKVKNLPAGCVGYQIVRCARHEEDMATISQGVLSKPVVNTYNRSFDKSGMEDGYMITKYHTYCPTGFLSTGMFIEGSGCVHQMSGSDNNTDNQCMANLANNSLLQFVSKEVCYQPESFKTFIKDKKYYIETPLFLFGSRGDKKFEDDIYDSPSNGKYIQADGKRIPEKEKLGTTYGITDHKFIFPGISNCTLETYVDKEGVAKRYVENVEFIEDDHKNIVYLDAYLNLDLMQRINPWAFTEYVLGNDRPYSFYPIKSSVYERDPMYVRYDTDSKIAEVTDKNGMYIQQKAFGYIKLYESSNVTNTFKGSGNVNVLDNYRKIIDFKTVEQIEWDKLFKRNYNKEGKNERSSKAFSNYAVSSGGHLFANVITGGLATDTDNNVFSNFGKFGGGFRGDATGNAGKHVLWGAGGRCLLFSCEDKNDAITNSVKTNQYYAPSDNTDAQVYIVNEYVRSSLLGTFLCNFRQQITPYGGSSFVNRLTNVYFGNGDYFKSSEDWNDVYNGDCNIEIFEYTSMHKTYGVYTDKSDAELKFPSTHMITYSIPTESNIWTKFEYGWQFSVNAADNYASFIQEEPAQITEAYTQDDPQFVYNTVYNTQNTSRPHAIYDDLNKEDYNKTIDTRVYYSDLKTNDEIIDSWCKFRSSNFIDVDQQYGPITDIYKFKNNLLFWQQKAFGILSVNERSITTDNSGNDVILGDGGVLSRYDYLSNTYGMCKQQFCVASSNGGAYWCDTHNNVICMFNGETVVELSKQGKVQSLMNAKADGSSGVFYDNKNNELVFNVFKDKQQIAFNEAIGKFTSVYTMPFEGYTEFFNGLYLINTVNDEVNIFHYDYMSEDGLKDTNGQFIKCYIKYTVNQQPLVTKVFDNQSIVTQEDLQSRPVYDKDDYFSINHKYTWETPMIKSASTLENNITLRENNHRFAIPRAGGLYGDRIRGKYMVCEITSEKPRYTSAIQFITTKYRLSWS